MQKHSSNSAKKRKNNKQVAIRVIALVLTALMVLGVAYYAIVLLTPSSSAADADDMIVSVGIMYGDGVTVTYPVSTVGGVTVGKQELTDDGREFTKLWTMPSAGFLIAIDDTLFYSESSSEYEKADGHNDYTVGGYHIELLFDFGSYDTAKNFCDTWGSSIAEYGIDLFPAYVNGEYKVRAGNFASLTEAMTAQTYVTILFSSFENQLVSPSETGVTAIDPTTKTIIFEFDNGADEVLGIKPTDASNYLKSPLDNIFSGVFAFMHYKTAKIDGVSVINVLPLEEYVAGVLPYEVSNQWPLETLKAFAIAVRSFTVNCRKLHMKTYSFDLCSTTHCQAYRGAKEVNDNVRQAVSETKGIVMTYGGKIATANYSSSVGGVTVGAADAWGGTDYPYAKAKRTPWEDYYHHASGFWTFEISPAQLLIYLRDTRGYTELKGTEIKDIDIIDYAKNSTYVKTIKFTDDKGNSVTIKNTDQVRTVLSTYAKSANFVVGKGSVDYFVDIVRNEPIVLKSAPLLASSGSSTNEQTNEQTNETADEELNVIKAPFKLTDYVVSSSDSVTSTSINMYVKVITGDGEYNYGKSGVNVICVEGAKMITNDPSVPSDDDPIVIEPGDIDDEDNAFSVIQNMTATASSEDNFIFVGKGWGHGVGMSQYGAYDLGKLGYKYDEILNMYFDGIVLKNYIKVLGLN